MLCKGGLGRRARSDTSYHLLRRLGWRISLCTSPGSTGAHCRNHARNHASQGYSSAVQLPKTIFGTVTTSEPSQTAIEQLLEPLSNAQAYPAAGSHSPSASPVLSLLVTPSFAQYALDDQLPLKAWKRLGGGSNGLKSIETVTAVVDRLPAVIAVKDNPPRVSEEQQSGHEGLAYLLTSRQEAASDVAEAAITMEEGLIPPLRGKPGTLNLTLPGSLSRSSHTLELPLAQTIFSTGRVSTLIQITYKADSEQKLQMQTQREPRSLRLALPNLSEGNTWTVDLPLLPLTPARQVVYSMGNILRQLLHTETGGNKPQPASQELEKAVSSYFDNVGIHAQGVSVWALIVPKKRLASQDNKSARDLLQMSADEIQRNWSARNGIEAHPDLQRRMNSGVLNLIYLGAKLCRVLSGGGGWGKKAGLLSLDPDNSYGVAEQGNIQVNPARRDDAGPLSEDTPSAFGQIAEVGDQVMFFLAPTGLRGLKEGGRRAALPENEDSTVAPQAFVFGALPSSIDSMPSAATSPGEPKITHTPNVFGMLSEGGMALELSSADPQSQPQPVTKTKLDVPYARFIGTKAMRPNTSRSVDQISQEASRATDEENRRRPLIKYFPTESRAWIRLVPVKPSYPVKASGAQRRKPSVRRQRRGGAIQQERLWAQRRLEHKARVFEMMAGSRLGSPLSEDEKPAGLQESLKKSLAEDVDAFFHRR